MALTTDMPRWEYYLSAFTHLILYALVLIMTVLGWAAANSRGWDVKLFGVITFPAMRAERLALGP